MKAQSGGRGIALPFNLGIRWGWAFDDTSRLVKPRERYLVPIVQEAEMALGLV
jgi:hypothetical protein